MYNTDMKNVVYLHGANASPENFNYYTLKMPEHPFIAPAYDMEDDPFDIVEILILTIVAIFHSMVGAQRGSLR